MESVGYAGILKMESLSEFAFGVSKREQKT